MELPNYKDVFKKDKIKTKKFELDPNYKLKYSGKKYFLKTYGCQMNEHDSENIKALLEEMGFTEVEEYKDADLVLLNTCSVRENAHNKAFGMLGRFKHLKEEKKDLVIGLCGCMAQEEGVIKEIKEKYKFVNFIFGTHNIADLPEILDRAINEGKQEIDVKTFSDEIIEAIPVRRVSNFKAYVNIIYGCDKFCTYCIVPYTRGREHSRKKEDILREVEALASDGYKEVTLLGQNVNAYGHDLYNDYSFGELLEDVAKTGIPRVRFTTSHPWNFTDKMIDTIAKYPNIMPSIHLPLQSGSDKVLKSMGRRYTKESYLKLFDKMKSKITNCHISTDIIVGFPGETEEDFQETLDVVNHCKYDNAYTFIYSPRENTPAAKFKNQVDEKTKEERLQILNKLVNKYFLENNKKEEGQTLEVLVEGKNEKIDGYYGYSKEMKLVNFTGKNIKIGDLVNVKITKAKTWSLDGNAN